MHLAKSGTRTTTPLTPHPTARPRSQFPVTCNDVPGTFVVDGVKVICACGPCSALPSEGEGSEQRQFHPTHWEAHCGAGTAKKWKASVKIDPGGLPEVPLGGHPMQVCVGCAACW